MHGGLHCLAIREEVQHNNTGMPTMRQEATTAVQEAPRTEDTAKEDDAKYGNSQVGQAQCGWHAKPGTCMALKRLLKGGRKGGVAHVIQAEDTARKAAANDPLEKFCGDNPETDECRYALLAIDNLNVPLPLVLHGWLRC